MHTYLDSLICPNADFDGMFNQISRYVSPLKPTDFRNPASPVDVN
ncbi:hypothetical protein [Spirosoma profusum]|nr:hypothetical protein [Spirosoma profusum]